MLTDQMICYDMCDLICKKGPIYKTHHSKLWTGKSYGFVVRKVKSTTMYKDGERFTEWKVIRSSRTITWHSSMMQA